MKWVCLLETRNFGDTRRGLFSSPTPPIPPCLPSACVFSSFFVFFSCVAIRFVLFCVCGFAFLLPSASCSLRFFGFAFLGFFMPVSLPAVSFGVRSCRGGFAVVSFASLALVCPRVLSLPSFARSAFVAWCGLGVYVGEACPSSRLWVARSLVSFRRLFASSLDSRSAFLSAWLSEGFDSVSSFVYRF